MCKASVVSCLECTYGPVVLLIKGFWQINEGENILVHLFRKDVNLSGILQSPISNMLRKVEKVTQDIPKYTKGARRWAAATGEETPGQQQPRVHQQLIVW